MQMKYLSLKITYRSYRSIYVF
nr:unnamed protein product [Callosobruchus chinensis]CAH7726947.1 unnamed protein product [Callosobruchus chinensis]CAH7736619.1 unnamed protein product [Callosobruchus chinensis]